MGRLCIGKRAVTNSNSIADADLSTLMSCKVEHALKKITKAMIESLGNMTESLWTQRQPKLETCLLNLSNSRMQA